MNRVVWVGLLAFAMAGPVVVPAIAAAQSGAENPEAVAPSAKPDAAAKEFPPSDTKAEQMTGAAPEAKPGTAESTEEKQNNAFRLEGPVVKWTAKTLNLSIEKTAVLFEIANFLIIVLGVGIPLIRILPKTLRARKQTLSDDIESARKRTEDANARLSAVEAKLASLDGEITKFRAEVEEQSKNDEKRIKASLGEESARILESAEQEISMASAQARRELRTFAAGLAVDQAAKQLTLSAETDRELIAEFVGDMLRTGGTGKGGLN